MGKRDDDATFEAERQFIKTQCEESKRLLQDARRRGDAAEARVFWHAYLRGMQLLLDLASREEKERQREEG